MDNLNKKLEITKNFAILIVALILGLVLIQKSFFTNSSANNQSARIQPTIGSKVNLTDVNWSNQSKTLILALQTSCHFCNESASFYKRIIQTVKDKNIKLIAVFPTKIEVSSAHLNELGLSNMEVKQSPLGNLQTSGTPTLILTNERGEIINFWVGKLRTDKEDEVINQLNS